jgi:SMI1-KNR4 cell-wall
LIARLYPEAQFSSGAAEELLEAVEQDLGMRTPDDLKELLRQSNGVLDRNGVGVIWSAERIMRDNRTFRSCPDFEDLYMSFEPLLFFADNGGGDQFAYVVKPSRFDIFVWDHESDGRWWVADGLSEYLTRRLPNPGDEWYRHD